MHSYDTMCVVYTFYFRDCGCLDHHDWDLCGGNCTDGNVQWRRGSPDTPGKCPNCAYPTPDSMRGRGSGTFTSRRREQAHFSEGMFQLAEGYDREGLPDTVGAII